MQIVWPIRSRNLMRSGRARPVNVEMGAAVARHLSELRPEVIGPGMGNAGYETALYQ